jgi:hypothetical protein
VLRISAEGDISLYPSFESRPTVPYSTNGRDIDVRRDDVADALVIPPATKSTADASAIVLGEELARASHQHQGGRGGKTRCFVGVVDGG